MSTRKVRLSLLVFTLPILLAALLWPLARTAAASTPAPSTGLFTPTENSAGFIGAAQAGCLSTVVVTSTNDSGIGTLRQALADVCSGGTVSFAAGLANQTITLTSTELSITKTVTITNPNAANLRVSGNNARRVFNIQAGAVVTITDLSIINGRASTQQNCYSTYNECGGSIINAGRLTINRVNFSGNSAGNHEFGINPGAGGVIYSTNIMTIANSTFSNNSADEGGVIYSRSILVITNSTFINNLAANDGGAIYNRNVLTITNSTFDDNSADEGGAIYNSYDITVTINNSTFSENSADAGGGAINNASGNSIITINSSTFSGNSAGSAGGSIYNSDSTLTLNNSTFSSNSAGYEGGGVSNFAYYDDEDAVLIVNNSTFSGNSANPYGSNIDNSGTMYLYNNILANSPAGYEDCWSFGGTIAANVNNLIEDGSCEATFSGDPNLGPLQNNGGSTPTHALLFPSSALDAGDPATCLAADQRGFSRPLDGNGDGTAVCDIGAVEMLNLTSSPDIVVLGNNTLIPNGDTTPSLTDHTDFGSTDITGGMITRTFTISNSGPVNLQLTGSPRITITGDTTDFTLVSPPGTPISPGSTTNFQIRFDPTASGLRSATLTIASNDPNKNPYFFKIQGGTCLSTITVANAGDSGSGTLRQALVDVCSGGTVSFANGLANQTITLTSVELSITKTVTITNPNAPNLKVSGNGEHRVLHIRAGAVVTMSGLSIISGTTTGDFGCPDACGGGIYNEGMLTVDNSIFNGNYATQEAGAIYNSDNATLQIYNSTFSNNRGEFGGGGIESLGTLIINNSVFDNNSSSRGGGLNNIGIATIVDGVFYHNSTSMYGVGGGIMNQGVLTLRSSTFSDNSSYDGGGIHSNGTLTIYESSFINNVANTSGGSILHSGSLTITNSVFNNNSAAFGGGIYASSATIIINNSTLSGNSANTAGGGIYNYQGTLTISNSTLNNNSAQEGGSIRNVFGTVHLRNSILANSSRGSDCINSNGTIATNLNNLIEDGSCNINATGFLTGDPNLGPLQDNGGPAPTHALLIGSLAIDAGDNATCLATDQRNFPRPLDGNGDGTATCDIGAFEALDPSTSVVQFTQPTYTASESIGLSQSVILTRTGNLSSISQVRVNLNGGTATPGDDYLSTTFPLTVTFGSGVASQIVPITLVNDTLVEPTETISLTVTGLSNAVIGTQSSAVLQIEDNDPEGSPPVGVYLPIVIKQ